MHVSCGSLHNAIQSTSVFIKNAVVMPFFYQAQEAALRSKPDIVVATPGRIIDHLHNSMSVDLEDLAVLILDEADRLLEIGFSAEIRELVCSALRWCMQDNNWDIADFLKNQNICFLIYLFGIISHFLIIHCLHARFVYAPKGDRPCYFQLR